jgi:hypothetical protein
MKSHSSFKNNKSSISSLKSSKIDLGNNIEIENITKNKFSEMKTDLVSILDTLTKEFVRLKQDVTEKIKIQELEINDSFEEVEKQLEESSKIQNDILSREKRRISSDSMKHRFNIRRNFLDNNNNRVNIEDDNHSLEEITVIPKRESIVKFNFDRVHPMIKEKKNQLIPELISADEINKNIEGDEYDENAISGMFYHLGIVDENYNNDDDEKEKHLISKVELVNEDEKIKEALANEIDNQDNISLENKPLHDDNVDEIDNQEYISLENTQLQDDENENSDQVLPQQKIFTITKARSSIIKKISPKDRKRKKGLALNATPAYYQDVLGIKVDYNIIDEDHVNQHELNKDDENIKVEKEVIVDVLNEEVLDEVNPNLETEQDFILQDEIEIEEEEVVVVKKQYENMD